MVMEPSGESSLRMRVDMTCDCSAYIAATPTSAAVESASERLRKTLVDRLRRGVAFMQRIVSAGRSNPPPGWGVRAGR